MSKDEQIEILKKKLLKEELKLKISLVELIARHNQERFELERQMAQFQRNSWNTLLALKRS